MILNRFVDSPDIGKLFLRLGSGTLMLSHGIYKIRTGVDDIAQWLSDVGVSYLFAYGVFIGEIIAPLCIILGFFVREASLILGINMIIALLYLYTKGYSPFGFDSFGGLNAEVDVLFLFAYFALMFLGGGKYGLSHYAKAVLKINRLHFKKNIP